MPRYLDCMEYERNSLLSIFSARQYRISLGGCNSRDDNFSLKRISNGTKITFFASRYPTKLYSTQRLALHWWSCFLTNYLISYRSFSKTSERLDAYIPSARIENNM